MKQKQCDVCQKFFEKGRNVSSNNWERARFCSLNCAAKDPTRNQAMQKARGRALKNGIIQVWNKGKVGFQNAWNKGNGEYAKELGFGKWMHGRKGAAGNNWKGAEVGYSALYDWVKRERGFPTTCEHCGLESTNRWMLHWANKSHEYKRDLEDWIRLCVKCHKKYDKGRKQKRF